MDTWDTHILSLRSEIKKKQAIISKIIKRKKKYRRDMQEKEKQLNKKRLMMAAKLVAEGKSLCSVASRFDVSKSGLEMFIRGVLMENNPELFASLWSGRNENGLSSVALIRKRRVDFKI